MEENGTTTTSASSSLPSFLLPVLVVLILPLFIYAQASLRRKYRRKQLGSMKQRQKLLTLYGWLEDLFPYGAKIDQETLQLVEKPAFRSMRLRKRMYNNYNRNGKRSELMFLQHCHGKRSFAYGYGMRYKTT